MKNWVCAALGVAAISCAFAGGADAAVITFHARSVQGGFFLEDSGTIDTTKPGQSTLSYVYNTPFEQISETTSAGLVSLSAVFDRTVGLYTRFSLNTLNLDRNFGELFYPYSSTLDGTFSGRFPDSSVTISGTIDDLSVTSVPLPASIWMLGLALVGLGSSRLLSRPAVRRQQA